MPLLFLCLLFLATSPAAADELTLKDGQKISGTIVGFENGMFRLETAYGYILVRKDQVDSVKMAASGGKERAQKPDDRQSPTRKSEAGASSENSSTPGRPGSASQADVSPSAAPAASSSRSDRDSPAQIAPAPTPPPPSHPVSEPLPSHIDEHVEGNSYVNDTFRFSMYKPPEWKVYDELPRGKVAAIVAIAAEDEQTLLFIDRQVWSGTPDLRADSVEAKLRETYEDYKLTDESAAQIDGRPAVRREFSGVMDGAEWYGVAIRVARGSTVFGIIGLTSGETYQFQKAVLSKIINSFHFLSPGSEPGFGPRASRTP